MQTGLYASVVSLDSICDIARGKFQIYVLLKLFHSFWPGSNLVSCFPRQSQVRGNGKEHLCGDESDCAHLVVTAGRGLQLQIIELNRYLVARYLCLRFTRGEFPIYRRDMMTLRKGEELSIKISDLCPRIERQL